MSRLLLIYLQFIFIINKVSGARILAIFPTPSISHQVVFRPLTQELARRGHEITVITPDPMFTKENCPANYTEIGLHDVSYEHWQQEFQDTGPVFGNNNGIFDMIDELTYFFGMIVEKQVKTKELQNILNDKSKKYDLLLLEACVRPALMFTHIFKAPVIHISSLGMIFGYEEVIGAPNHPLLYATAMHQRIFNLTFWEKLNELYKHFWISYKWQSSESFEHKLLNHYFGGDVPPYNELYNNIDMLFLNIHPLWSNNIPLPPNVISIWGVHKQPQNPLPQDLQTYLDSSKNGVIYLSFGSNAKSIMLPKRRIQMLINVFSKLPYDILWKWEDDELPGKSDNIKISKWLPQPDLLRHPKIKLFITQGGLQSTDEAMDAGVPLVGIPMLADQWFNVELFEYHKIGVKVDFVTITEEKLTKAIETVINDKSYKENMLKLRELMNDQPENALDRAIWWTEYVLRHGGAKHLRAPAANMPWTEYYEIDFLLKLLFLVLSILVVILTTLYLLYKYFEEILFSKKLKVS